MLTLRQSIHKIKLKLAQNRRLASQITLQCNILIELKEFVLPMIAAKKKSLIVTIIV